MSTAAATNRRFLSLSFFLLICYAAWAAGGSSRYPNVAAWYNHLHKPDWTPSHELFASIWMSFYGTMAIAAWLVWERLHGGAFPALKLFSYQLGLNVLWFILFFALRSPDAAAAEIVVLWLLSAATAIAFFKIHRLAGILLIPYCAGITFATVLNLSISQNN
jgi:benzodiazapine receptor